jgi:DNA polymerase-1
MAKKLVLIDSNAIIHRAYHALPKSFSNRAGERTNAVYGFTTTVIKVLEDLHPDYMVASFDVGKATFRTDTYKEYKAHRVAADQELYDQIPRVRELLAVLNVPVFDCSGFEADDCIGTITKKLGPQREKGELEVYIVTGDKDLFQLVDGNIFVYNLRKGLSDTGIYDSRRIKEEFNLDPADFIDLKALAGDPSDNIPGVPGIGPKTATTLIQDFDKLEYLYKRIGQALEQSGIISKSEFLISNQIPSINDSILKQISEELGIKPRILQLLIDYKEQAFLSQSLATIHKEVPMEFDLEACKWGDYDKEKLREFFTKMSFTSLLKRFGILPAEPTKTKQAEEQKKKDEQLKLL